MSEELLGAEVAALGRAEPVLEVPTRAHERLAAAARAALGCAGADLFIVHKGTLTLAGAAHESVPLAKLRVQAIAAPVDGASVVGHVAMTGSAYVTADAYAGEHPFDQQLDLQRGTRTRALLAVPLLDADQAVIGVLQLSNPRGGEPFGPHDLKAAQAMATQASLVLEYAGVAGAAQAEYFTSLCQLAAISERDDPDVPWHVRRVSGYATVLARAVDLPGQDIERIRLATPLHDLGKVGIPGEILNKPGKLSDAEFEATKAHCELGARLLTSGGTPVLRLAGQIARTHHERWDGTGYPSRLVGAEIPLAGRLTALADVFDALTTRRPYKPALGIEQSLRILRQESGRHFDPELVEAFQSVLPQLLAVKDALTPADED